MLIRKLVPFHALVFVLAIASHSVGAQESMSSAPKESVIEPKLAPLLSDSADQRFGPLAQWRVGRWKIDEKFDVEAGYFCISGYRFGIYPALGKCFGSLQLFVSKERMLARHKRTLENIAAKHKRELAGLNPFQVYIEAQNQFNVTKSISETQFKELMDQEDRGWTVTTEGAFSAVDVFANLLKKGHLLTINNAGYELQGFKAIVEKNIGIVERVASVEIQEQRRQLWTMAYLVALGLAVCAFILFWLVRFVRRHLAQAKEKARQLKDAASGQVDKLQAANQRRKVRSVMMDETIREMTRTALSGADDKSKEVLIAELRKAIESGNHELANALETALKKA